MKRIAILLISLILVAGIAYYLTTQGQSNASSNIDTSDRDFGVKDVESIKKIFIATRNKEPITLTKENGYWLINGEHRAGDNQINNILAAVSRVKVDHIPHQNARENIIRDIGLVGVKVEVYGSEKNPLKTYYVGNTTQDMLSTYYLMEGASQPYAVQMPGFVGSMRGRFTNTAKDLRSLVYIQEKPEDITEVSVEYPKQQKQSFKLTKVDNDYSVEPYYELTRKINKPVSKARVRAYLEGFDKLAAEYIDNENTGRDTILNKVPFAILSYKTAKGSERSLKLYPLNELINQDTDLRDLESLNRVHRVFAECSWGDFLLIQMRNFQKLLRPYAFFFE